MTGASQANGLGSAKAPEPSGLGPTGAIPSAWECFSDVAYFDMWCVRPVGSRKFGEGFHVINERSATELRDYLNSVGEIVNG